MAETLSALRRQRTLVLGLNLVYFLALLALGVTVFLRSRAGALGVAAALAVYLLLVRPMTERYKRAIRAAILEYGVCDGMTDVTYAPREGFTAGEFLSSGLINTVSDKAFLSREKVTARRGDMALTMADVTFPIREGGRNAMSSGLYIRLQKPGAVFPALTISADDTEGLSLSGKAAALVREMASFVPGNLYLHADGETLHVFFRGRFVGFSINPLMNLSERILRANPLPEAEQALRLALMLAAGQERNG